MEGINGSGAPFVENELETDSLFFDDDRSVSKIRRAMLKLIEAAMYVAVSSPKNEMIK